MEREEHESKLKQMRRQKEQAEEELESSSEKWRAERRRLNAEIDRLERTLLEAKEARGKRGTESKVHGIDPSEVAKIQQAADNKLQKAATEWEAEREKLKSQIGRLERAVAETIERSNNPLRSTQPIREQLENKIEELAKQKTEVEQAFLRSKTEWEQEKLRMTGEMVKLRRAAQIMGRPLPKETAPEINPRVQELEKQLQDNLARWNSEREQLEELCGARNDWDTERHRLAAEIDRLEQQLQRTSGNRDRVSGEVVDQLRKQYEQRLQEAIEQKMQLAQELQNASTMLESERSRLTDEIAKSRSPDTPAGSGGNGMNTEAITAEVGRVEKMIRDIARLIDDPATELSAVIRKNVEKAELDAYLKGILFSLGRTKGL